MTVTADALQAPYKYRYQLYQALHGRIAQINADARQAADDIGIPEHLRGKIGLTGSVSSCHALLRRDVSAAMERAAREVIENKYLVDELRELVKDGYGDDFDVAPINTCEAALWLSFDTLVTPPMTGRGENYRTRYVAPYERHVHHQAGYGRPFPPKYKELTADRGVTAGEFGVAGKRLENLDTVLVPLVGARYEGHGIKYSSAVLLADVDARRSAEAINDAAQRNLSTLAAFASMGYDTPGYGQGHCDEDGTPTLMRLIGETAQKYNVPYIVDNAKGVPFLGVDPRRIKADVMVYSMDKASGAPTGGLIIGREDHMVAIRRALGIGGSRDGGPLSYGKAAYVGFDAGKEYLVGLLAALRAIRDTPEVINKPLQRMYEITTEEFDRLTPELRADIRITKSLNGATVEINYQDTWKDGRIGLPIFTIEDMYAGTALLQTCMARMGVVPSVAYDGNIMITPGLGTTDEDGMLLEEPMRLAIRGLVELLIILCRHTGLYGYSSTGR